MTGLTTLMTEFNTIMPNVSANTKIIDIFTNLLPSLIKIMTHNIDNYYIARSWYHDLITDKYYKTVNTSSGKVDIYSMYKKYIYTVNNPMLYIHEYVCTNLQQKTEYATPENIYTYPRYILPDKKHPNYEIVLQQINDAYAGYSRDRPLLYETYNMGEKCKCNFVIARTAFPQCEIVDHHTCAVKRGSLLNLLSYNEWLLKHHKVICAKIIKNEQLNYIIQNTSYDELFELFKNSGSFNIDKYNVLEFLMLLAFLGNDGIPHNLYCEIKLNPEY
jgi:hypothetical protein